MTPGRCSRRRTKVSFVPQGGGLFPDWLDAQIDKAAREDSPLAGLPGRIKEMHRLYGATAEKRCGGCKFFHTYQQSTRWHKCHKSRVTGGAATDWRVKWPACGLYEERPKDRETGADTANTHVQG